MLNVGKPMLSAPSMLSAGGVSVPFQSTVATPSSVNLSLLAAQSSIPSSTIHQQSTINSAKKLKKQSRHDDEEDEEEQQSDSDPDYGARKSKSKDKKGIINGETYYMRKKKEKLAQEKAARDAKRAADLLLGIVHPPSPEAKPVTKRTLKIS